MGETTGSIAGQVIPPPATPRLPPEAMQIGRRHEMNYNQPAFTWAMQRESLLECPNCGGGGIVYLRLAEKGPYHTPSTLKQPSTWFEGNGHFPKGWYVIKETYAFECPDCHGKRQFQSRPAVPRPGEVDLRMRALSEKASV